MKANWKWFRVDVDFSEDITPMDSNLERIRGEVKYIPEDYENLLFSLNNINPNLVLGGSLALHIFGIMPLDFDSRVPDLDFSLQKKFTEEEFLFIKDFFNLELGLNWGDYGERYKDDEDNEYLKISKYLNGDILQLKKIEILKNEFVSVKYKLDFFNQELLPNRDLVYVKYKDIDLKLVHPSRILKFKSSYAYDVRVSSQYKHFMDLKSIDWSNYFQIAHNITPIYDNSDSGTNNNFKATYTHNEF